MGSKPGARRISRQIGKFRGDRRAIRIMAAFAVVIGLWGWLEAHPQHNPWAPLDLRHPIGMATGGKLDALKQDVDECRAVLDRSEVPFRALEGTGEGPCEMSDRTRLTDYPLAPDTPGVSCPLAIALELWRTKSVAPAAIETFGSDLATIEHLGAYSCRRLYGRDEGPWSEHASANAIDITAFVLEDGTRISVLDDWSGDERKRRFLRRVRDDACGVFATVLSPDYNQAHADHFHFDQQQRWSGFCR